MAGVPAGYLSPRLPFPPNADYNVSVGVEIAPGLGISLDGKALLVGPEGHQGRTDIIGHLEDGTYKNRDTVVLRSGDETTVDGDQQWRDFSMKGKRRAFLAAGDTDRQGFTVASTDSGFRVKSKFAARAWTVSETPRGASVSSKYEDGERFTVRTQGNTTIVDSNLPDQDFTITRNADGSVLIDGKYSPDDFTFRSTDSGYELKGFYPQQHFKIVEA